MLRQRVVDDLSPLLFFRVLYVQPNKTGAKKFCPKSGAPKFLSAKFFNKKNGAPDLVQNFSAPVLNVYR